MQQKDLHRFFLYFLPVLGWSRKPCSSRAHALHPLSCRAVPPSSHAGSLQIYWNSTSIREYTNENTCTWISLYPKVHTSFLGKTNKTDLVFYTVQIINDSYIYCGLLSESLRPAPQLWRRWENDQHSSISVSPLLPRPPHPTPQDFSEAGGRLCGTLPRSHLCRTSHPPWAWLVWTFRIRICNDVEQSQGDAAHNGAAHTSDHGAEGSGPTWHSRCGEEARNILWNSSTKTSKNIFCLTHFPSLWPQSIIYIQAA